MPTKTVGHSANSETSASAPKKTMAADKQSQSQASTQAVHRAGPRTSVGHPMLAAERAMRRNSLHLRLPIIGELHLPSGEELAFIGGVAFLAVVGILEWPVAALLCLGHGLAVNRRNKVLRAFGEALEGA